MQLTASPVARSLARNARTQRTRPGRANLHRRCTKPHLTGQGAKVALNLAAVKEGSEIEELSVTDERRQQSGADPTPDIIFFHDGGNGHLLCFQALASTRTPSMVMSTSEETASS